jgi:Secretion system C-terminal sorting domain/Bacterial pre-peptidase C-terminal domain
MVKCKIHHNWLLIVGGNLMTFVKIINLKIMKQLKLKFAIFFLTMFSTITQLMAVNESEPNSLWNQADPINLGATANGTCVAGGDTDWWKVTTAQDGALNINLTATNSVYTWASIYDTTGAVLLYQNYTITNSTITWNGLAKGTYYINIRAFYTTDAPTYSFVPTVTPAPGIMETEPNGTPLQALTLLPNDSITGHIGFYYNNKRDTTDCYKVTTTKDGQLDLTITTLENNYVWVTLFDNTGTTVLASNYNNFNAGSSITISRKDLAAATYFIKIYSFYSNDFSGYALKSKFIQNPKTNDVEPNNVTTAALNYTTGSTVTGHIGFYKNGLRDLIDYYKVNITSSGKLDLTVTNHMLNYVWVKLYDINGTTILAQNYTANTPEASITISYNNLAKGIYYIGVNSFYASDYSSYTLSSTFQSAGGDDPEKNNSASRAKLVGGYSNQNGNVGYYSNASTDVIDWHKLDYFSDSGPLTITITPVVHTFDANFASFNYKLYKDTNAAPLANVNFTNGTPNTYTYNTLTAGAHYIKIERLYSTFGEYKIQPNYKDTTSQTVTLASFTSGINCNQGKLSYFVTRGRAPYSCQLYKDDVAYGAAIITSDSAAYSSLPSGNYQLKVKGNGASTFTVNSQAKVICPKPKNLTATSITSSGALIGWFNFTCADGYILSYKKSTATVFTNDTLLAGATTKSLTGLVENTIYNYKMRAYHKVGNIYYLSAYSAPKTFTTLDEPGQFFADQNEDAFETVLVYPNPASDFVKIATDGNWEKIEVYNSLSQLVASEIINSSENKISQIDISDLKAGLYQIVIKRNNETISKQFTKE